MMRRSKTLGPGPGLRWTRCVSTMWRTGGAGAARPSATAALDMSQGRFGALSRYIIANRGNDEKLSLLINSRRRLGFFDMGFDLSQGGDIEILHELIRGGNVDVKGMGSLMKAAARSTHPQYGRGIDLIACCFCDTEQATERMFKTVYSTKMKQITIDILIHVRPMDCVKFLGWFRECGDFSPSFHSLAKFRLVQQQASSRFHLPVKTTDEDVANVLRHNAGGYLKFLMQNYQGEDRFDKFLAIYFQSLEKGQMGQREIQKCNSLFLNHLVKTYDTSYDILLGYMLKLYDNEETKTLFRKLKLYDSPGSRFAIRPDDLPSVDVNDKLCTPNSMTYISDLKLVYRQLFNHNNISEKELWQLFERYVSHYKYCQLNVRGDNHPFAKHDSSILVEFMKYASYVLKDFKLSFKMLSLYIRSVDYTHFASDMTRNNQHKHIISLHLSKYSNTNLDRVSRFEEQHPEIIWDWCLYYQLIVNAYRLNEMEYCNYIWEKVKSQPRLWSQITKDQACILLSFGLPFKNKDLVLQIESNGDLKLEKEEIKEPESYLVDKLSPDSVLKLLSN